MTTQPVCVGNGPALATPVIVSVWMRFAPSPSSTQLLATLGPYNLNTIVASAADWPAPVRKFVNAAESIKRQLIVVWIPGSLF